MKKEKMNMTIQVRVTDGAFAEFQRYCGTINSTPAVVLRRYIDACRATIYNGGDDER